MRGGRTGKPGLIHEQSDFPRTESRICGGPAPCVCRHKVTWPGYAPESDTGTASTPFWYVSRLWPPLFSAAQASFSTSPGGWCSPAPVTDRPPHSPLMGRGHSSDSSTKTIVLLVALAIAATTVGPVGVGLGGSGLIGLILMVGGLWLLYQRAPVPPALPQSTSPYVGAGTAYPGTGFTPGPFHSRILRTQSAARVHAVHKTPRHLRARGTAGRTVTAISGRSSDDQPVEGPERFSRRQSDRGDRRGRHHTALLGSTRCRSVRLGSPGPGSQSHAAAAFATT